MPSPIELRREGTMRSMKTIRAFAIAFVGVFTACGVPERTEVAPAPGAGEVTRTPMARPDDVTGLSAIELRDRIARGELTARAVTQAHLSRITGLDDSGPGLNAVTEINPDAEVIAAALDEHRLAGGEVGPLHGVPVLLKGNIDTGDRMATDAGSLALAGHRAAADAQLVARLRQAGAVIRGKTNLSEWANFRSSDSASGWSSVAGQTRNPHVLDRNPCGSSSGSAAAVAAYLVPLAVGTETDGSIICPSGTNGIVGIKPTVGTVSRHGIIPISHTQDTAGPMARTVADAALLLQVLIGADPADAGSRAFPDGPPDLVPEVWPERLDGRRIGVYRNYHGAGQYPAVEAVYTAALDALEALGATLIDPLDFSIDEAAYDAEYEVMLFEFKSGLNAYLRDAGLPDDRNSLAALIAWNEAHAETVMPIFGQDIFIAAEAKADLSDPAYAAALAAGPHRVRDELHVLFAELALDAVVTVANAFAWKTDWLAGDRFMVGSSSLAAMSGFPSVTVPAGDVWGLPVGVAFVGRPFTEAPLVGIAHAFERSTTARRSPQFLPTLETVR
jgi:amidase